MNRMHFQKYKDQPLKVFIKFCKQIIAQRRIRNTKMIIVNQKFEGMENRVVGG